MSDGKKRTRKIEVKPIARDEIGRINFPGSAMSSYAMRLLDVLFERDGFRLETERNGKTLIIWQIRGKIV